MLIKEQLPEQLPQANPFADILANSEQEHFTIELILILRYLAASLELQTFSASGEEADEEQLTELEKNVEATGAEVQMIIETLQRETLVKVIMTLLLHVSNNTSLSVLLEFLDSDLSNEWSAPTVTE